MPGAEAVTIPREDNYWAWACQPSFAHPAHLRAACTCTDVLGFSFVQRRDKQPPVSAELGLQRDSCGGAASSWAWARAEGPAFADILGLSGESSALRESLCESCRPLENKSFTLSMTFSLSCFICLSLIMGITSLAPANSRVLQYQYFNTYVYNKRQIISPATELITKSYTHKHTRYDCRHGYYW